MRNANLLQCGWQSKISVWARLIRCLCASSLRWKDNAKSHFDDLPHAENVLARNMQKHTNESCFTGRTRNLPTAAVMWHSYKFWHMIITSSSFPLFSAGFSCISSVSVADSLCRGKGFLVLYNCKRWVHQEWIFSSNILWHTRFCKDVLQDLCLFVEWIRRKAHAHWSRGPCRCRGRKTSASQPFASRCLERQTSCIATQELSWISFASMLQLSHNQSLRLCLIGVISSLRLVKRPFGHAALHSAETYLLSTAWLGGNQHMSRRRLMAKSEDQECIRNLPMRNWALLDPQDGITSGVERRSKDIPKSSKALVRRSIAESVRKVLNKGYDNSVAGNTNQSARQIARSPAVNPTSTVSRNWDWPIL